MGLKPLIEFATYPIEDHELNRSVQEFVNESGNWLWGEFASKLFNQAILLITGTHPPVYSIGDDSAYWDASATEEFTGKSACEALRKDKWDEAQDGWSSIWKLKIPQRIKTFL